MSIKRFYDKAMAVSTPEGWAVQLDGRSAKTPKMNPLTCPTGALARAVAEEWNETGETVLPERMRLTQLANLALDRAEEERAAWCQDMRQHMRQDVLCHFAPHPESLIEAQGRLWKPVLDWAAECHAIRLYPAEGLMPVDQPEESLSALDDVLKGFDTWHMAGLYKLAASLHSTLLALAVVGGRLDAAGAFEAGLLEEMHQAEHWGEDEEAAARRMAIRQDIEAAALFISLIREED